MPAADYGAIIIGNLGSIARMVPVHNTSLISNVGTNWAFSVYTVPTGRILVLDSAMIVCRGGTLPAANIVAVHDSGGTLQARLVWGGQSTLNEPAQVSGAVWLAEGWSLRVATSGGDATTDMVWSFSGRLFDWSDFGPS